VLDQVKDDVDRFNAVR